MQFASLVPHQVEIPHESFSSSIRVRSQDLTILDKACKVVVVSLETANQFFPLCFAQRIDESVATPIQSDLQGVHRRYLWASISAAHYVSVLCKLW